MRRSHSDGPRAGRGFLTGVAFPFSIPRLGMIPHQPFLRALTRILLLALAYVVAGRISLLLAIPPGYASAIFPPVGIALAAVLIWGYRMLAGVFVGSALLNLSIAFSANDELNLTAVLVALGIAVSTSLQSLLGSWLIRRFVGVPSPLIDERSIVIFLFLGGPLTCVLSASGAVAVLYVSQTIPATEVLYSWWTWWVGDSIGVLIASVAMFILFAEPRALWRRRASTVGLPLAMSCAIMVSIFVLSSHAQQEKLRLRFHEQAKSMAATLEFRFEFYKNSVQSIERFFSSSDEVSREDFGNFVSNLLSAYPSIQALSWNTRVSVSHRSSYEEKMAAAGHTGFTITEQSEHGGLKPAGLRSHYVPVTFIAPASGNKSALGYDVASNPVRADAMRRADRSGQAAMTAPIKLVQNEVSQPGTLLFVPVYKHHIAGKAPDNSTMKPKGYAVAVLRTHDLIHSALSTYPKQSYTLQINDISSGSPVPFFGTHGKTQALSDQALVWQKDLNAAGRVLRVAVSPTKSFLQNNRGLQAWAVLAGGLFLCSMLGGFLLILTGRAEQIESLVKQRTLELSAILENAVEGILIFDKLGVIERANPAAAKLFGCDKEQLAGRALSSFIPSLGLLHASESQNIFGAPLEVLGLRSDASKQELEISLSTFELPDRELFVCTLHDISARKKVERLKSEFVATVSHELRTPLTSVRGALGLLANGVAGELSKKAKKLIGIAHDNSMRLINLVNDIMDIEKLELNQARVQLARTDLRGLLKEALVHNQSYTEAYSVHLALNDDALPDAVMVDVDSMRLHQVLSNLIANAVKFSEPEDTVEISAKVQTQDVRVQIRDHGPGVAEDFRDRIFQKFAQADGSDSRSAGGTGLGLSICKGLVEQMNGTIDYDSVPGEGSTFYFTLPLAEEPQETSSA